MKCLANFRWHITNNFSDKIAFGSVSGQLKKSVKCAKFARFHLHSVTWIGSFGINKLSHTTKRGVKFKMKLCNYYSYFVKCVVIFCITFIVYLYYN